MAVLYISHPLYWPTYHMYVLGIERSLVFLDDVLSRVSLSNQRKGHSVHLIQSRLVCSQFLYRNNQTSIHWFCTGCIHKSNLYIHVHVCTWGMKHTYIHTYMYVCTCMYVRTYTGVCVKMLYEMYMIVHVHFVYTCVHTHVPISSCIYVREQARTCLYMLFIPTNSPHQHTTDGQ